MSPRVRHQARVALKRAVIISWLLTFPQPKQKSSQSQDKDDIRTITLWDLLILRVQTVYQSFSKKSLFYSNFLDILPARYSFFLSALSRKRIGLMSMLGVYIVLFVGMFISFITLLVELYWKRRAKQILMNKIRKQRFVTSQHS